MDCLMEQTHPDLDLGEEKKVCTYNAIFYIYIIPAKSNVIIGNSYLVLL